MSQKEANRPGLVQAAEKQQITNAEGAAALGLTIRQFRRLRADYRGSGVEGLLHGNRGRSSPKRLSEETRKQVLDLMVGKYLGFNDSHLTEKLRTVEKLALSREMVRRIRIEAKLPAKRKRRSPKHHHRRQRKAREGAMVLIDGSRHDWLEGRGPMFTLVGAIDDATGRVLALIVREQEDMHGYMALLEAVVSGHGVPLAFYGDRFGALVRNDDHWTLQEQLEGRQQPTAFGLLLEKLGTAFIPARSPQAKGRIERLWETLQDRLVSEMRLLGLATLEQVVEYLPRFIAEHNARFGKAAAEAERAWRPAPRALDDLLGCSYPRKVARDNTVSIRGRWIQLPARAHGRSWQNCSVEVRECLNGSAIVLHRGVVVARQSAPAGLFTLVQRDSGIAKERCPENFAAPHRVEPRPARKKKRLDRRGNLTNIRKQAEDHAWRRPYKPPTTPA